MTGQIAAAALGFATLMLAGCDGGSEKVDPTEEGAGAQGEILGGTISDAMIPVEELRSSSPPAGQGSNTGSPQDDDGEAQSSTSDTSAQDADASAADAEDEQAAPDGED
ncbi:MAG: hypothetical protein EX262_06120 [Sphingomonadaceae bacterium]|nr:MAG: hypothetical protein EX262_06120 [Sphingomonadaceae bacterium]